MERIEQLFRQHYSKMFLVSRILLGDEETARDVVSDIFADLLNGTLKLPPQCSEGYFVVLARNRFLNHLRKLTTQEKVKAGQSLDASIDISHTEDKLVGEIDQEMSKLDQMLSFIDSELTPQTRKVVSVTNASGNFVIPCGMKKVIAKVSCVGYHTYYNIYNVGRVSNITLRESAVNIKGVVVKAKRPSFKMGHEGMQVDIQHTDLAKVGDALDVFRELPRLNVSNNGAISIFGKGTPLVLQWNLSMEERWP